MTKIQWAKNRDGSAGKTWNPMVGCSKASPGCENCYAMGDSPHRFASTYEREGVVKLRDRAAKPGLTWVPTNPTTGKSLGKGAQWTGEVRLLPWQLEAPLKRKKPTTYFVNSIADTFHESVVDSEEGRRFIAAMFGVMAACPQHTFQVLTKRPHKAREWFAWLEKRASEHMTDVFPDEVIESCIIDANDHLHAMDSRDAAETLMNRWIWAQNGVYGFEAEEESDLPRINRLINRQRKGPQIDDEAWPLPNVWIGTSVEDQRRADERIPHLLEVPAALRFLSCEPLLGPLDLSAWLEPTDHCGACDHRRDGISEDVCDACGTPGNMTTAWGHDQLDAPPISWAIAGGESGPKARPCEVVWLRSIVDQCKAARVPVFVKQLGSVVLARSEDDLGPVAHADRDSEHAGEPFPPEGYIPRLASKKGDDPAEWPEALRVREMPDHA